MKKLACKDLEGACDEVFEGETLQEMGENAKKHVMVLMEKGDTSHDAAMEKMRDLSDEEREVVMDGMQRKFDEAEEI